MVYGRSIIYWIFLVVIAGCVFALAQWFLPPLFAIVGWVAPAHIVSIMAFLIALGVVFGGYRYRG